MQYKVLPFTAKIVKGEGAVTAAQQLADLANANAEEGWEYVRLESVKTIITTPAVPANAGCLGIGCFGATPGVPASHEEAVVYMIVFRKP